VTVDLSTTPIPKDPIFLNHQLQGMKKSIPDVKYKQMK
jgi:hypothetical protein